MADILNLSGQRPRALSRPFCSRACRCVAVSFPRWLAAADLDSPRLPSSLQVDGKRSVTGTNERATLLRERTDHPDALVCPHSQNKDIHWYSRDEDPKGDAAALAKAEEIRKIKDAEEDALAVALCVLGWLKRADRRCICSSTDMSLLLHPSRGFAPKDRSNANLIEIKKSDEDIAKEKEEKIKRKA